MESTLLCFRLAINHRLRHNVVRTEKRHTRINLSVSLIFLLHSVTYLTNRFQVAVRLFSNRSQMKSKCGKNNRLESLFYLIKG